MKWLGILIVAAIALMLAGCAASPQQPPLPPSSPAGGEQSPQAPQSAPPAPGNNATPPSPPPGAQAPPAVAPSGKPDLQLQAITFDNPAAIYKVMNGSVTNYNSGTAPSPATKTAYYIDGTLLGTVDVPPMDAGASSTVGITFVCPSAGGHTLSAKIDYENQVDEQDELNNGRAVSFTCGS